MTLGEFRPLSELVSTTKRELGCFSVSGESSEGLGRSHYSPRAGGEGLGSSRRGTGNNLARGVGGGGGSREDVGFEGSGKDGIPGRSASVSKGLEAGRPVESSVGSGKTLRG